MPDYMVIIAKEREPQNDGCGTMGVLALALILGPLLVLKWAFKWVFHPSLAIVWTVLALINLALGFAGQGHWMHPLWGGVIALVCSGWLAFTVWFPKNPQKKSTDKR